MVTFVSLPLLLLVASDWFPRPPAPFTASRFREHVAYLASDDLAGREVDSPGNAKAVAYLMRHLKESGAHGLGPGGDWVQPFPWIAKLQGHNVLGVVPGKGDLAAEAVIVSAHHDHLGVDPTLIRAGKDGIYNGADDNASGCSALLLVADALLAERDLLPASRRTVIFASFDAEERGLLGSRYYVSHPLWPLQHTTANINFDMVGRLNRGGLTALDSQSNPFLAERVKALGAACGVHVETRLGGARRADSASFLDREIPAVHFNTGMHADYHQVTDEVSRIDAEGGARVAWLAYRLLRDVMTTPSRLRYTQPPVQFDVERILRLVVRMGIVPEMNTQPGRYPLIQTVFPGSIAARYGLKSGDEIAGVNGKRFQSLMDAGIAFGQIRLKDGVRLTVRRGGKDVDLKLPPEAFQDFLGPAVRALGNDLFEVHFRFKAPGKPMSVVLAGTFNDWSLKALSLEGPDKLGYYETKLRLRRGSYEYKFVVDGKTWVADPSNFSVIGPSGNSLLTVGDGP
jgi:hypothetical protein